LYGLALQTLSGIGFALKFRIARKKFPCFTLDSYGTTAEFCHLRNRRFIASDDADLIFPECRKSVCAKALGKYNRIRIPVTNSSCESREWMRMIQFDVGLFA